MIRLAQSSLALTFDDVLLVPDHSNILPAQTSLVTNLTNEITLNMPLISSAMDTVTESRLAIAIAQEGGIGIIHKNLTIEQQAAEVRKVKKFESGVVKDPITISPTTTVRELISITENKGISGLPVVEKGQLVGIVTRRDFRFADDLEQPVSAIMTPKERLVTVLEGASREEIVEKLYKNRIEKLLVVDNHFRLKGLVTVKDIQKAKEKPFASKDKAGQLYVGAAVSVGEGTEERIAALVSAGVDVLVVDTAHGHSQKVINRTKWVKENYPYVQVIAGNVATKDAAIALVEAGANAIKVGIGPGSICTTRIVAGVGVPQISAISNVAHALVKKGIPLVADGGIRHSGDVAKAIAAGAYTVMIGGLFAGTEEAPGEVELYKGRSYKSYRGMGSLGAMANVNGSRDRYFQEETEINEKLVPEGIEGRVPYKGSILAIIHQLLGGLRASMGYTGCHDLATMRTKPKFIQITQAGMRESHVHDVTITKEAPNYPTE